MQNNKIIWQFFLKISKDAHQRWNLWPQTMFYRIIRIIFIYKKIVLNTKLQVSHEMHQSLDRFTITPWSSVQWGGKKKVKFQGNDFKCQNIRMMWRDFKNIFSLMVIKTPTKSSLKQHPFDKCLNIAYRIKRKTKSP